MDVSNLNIRALTQADQDALWEILYYAIHVPEGVAAPPRAIAHQPQLARYVQGWDSTNDLGFGAFVENKMIGAAWLRALTRENRGYGFWNDETPELSIALAPKFRGQGIGTRLLQMLLDAAAIRYRAVSLSVDKQNPARHLYERFGFVIVEYDATSLLMLRQFKHESSFDGE